MYLVPHKQPPHIWVRAEWSYSIVNSPTHFFRLLYLDIWSPISKKNVSPTPSGGCAEPYNMQWPWAWHILTTRGAQKKPTYFSSEKQHKMGPSQPPSPRASYEGGQMQTAFLHMKPCPSPRSAGLPMKPYPPEFSAKNQKCMQFGPDSQVRYDFVNSSNPQQDASEIP